MKSSISPVQQLHLYHVGQRKWRDEYGKLLTNIYPYDCDDNEALKRFDSVLNAFDRRQELKIQNRNRSEKSSPS